MLTDAQYQALANHIRANTDPDVQAALSIRNDTELARLYNLDGSAVVWRPRLTRQELRTQFDWPELVANMTATEWQSWAEMTADGFVDPGDANIRAGFAEIFKGPQKAVTRNALVSAAQRPATVYEEVFLTGPDSPDTLVVTGPANIATIGKALNGF